MGNLSLRMTGDWKRAGITLKNLAVKLYPAFSAKIYEDGEMVLERMKGHIYNQDLNWTPLSENTVRIKGGDTTIMIDTGTLVDGLTVRRIKSSVKGSTIFVGASPWKTHGPSGMKMSEIMIWLEYGTDKLPPRPLMQPTMEEVEHLLQKGWTDFLKDLVDKGG